MLKRLVDPVPRYLRAQSKVQQRILFLVLIGVFNISLVAVNVAIVLGTVKEVQFLSFRHLSQRWSWSIP